MSESKGKKCCKLFRLDWHYSSLFFFHHDWKAFAYTPWLPYKWPFQLIYVVYRWFLALYFLGWQIASIASYAVPIYMIFLTHWGFITLNISLIISALSVTTKYISVHFICKKAEEEFSHKHNVKWKAPQGCCGRSDNGISWYQMIQWFFTILSYDIALCILVLYWSSIYNGGPIDGINANTHLMNGLVSVIDLCFVSGVPVNTLHVIYPVIFAVIYSLFTGLYYAGSQNAVYSVLDYGENLGFAIGLCIIAAFVLIPVIHLILFYPLYKLKVFILYSLFRPPIDEQPNKELDKLP